MSNFSFFPFFLIKVNEFRFLTMVPIGINLRLSRVFDSFFIENSIPLLGKYVNDNLFETLYDKCGKGVVVCLDSDAWDDATKIYHRLNGGRLYDKIKIVKLIEGYDVADLKGEIKDEYFFNIK